MKKLIFTCFFFVIFITTYSQVNCANTKKSIPYRANYQRMDAGGKATLEIRDGTLWAWGYNFYGQLGNGTYDNDSVPKQVGADNNWVSISVSDAHNLGLKSDGSLWAWGYNNEGQLGDSTTTSKNIPVQIGTDNNWVSVNAGYYHSLGLKSDGTLWSWGSNSYGQLGDGTIINKSKPLQIGVDSNWVSISAGLYHSYALKSNGTLWAWGYNFYGQLGDGTNTDKSNPLQIGTDSTWVIITAGEASTFGLKSDGTLWAWGMNSNGQLGDGTIINKNSPVQIGTDNNWVSITSGFYHTVGLKSDGTLWAWGDNSTGQLGNGTTTAANSPMQIGTDNNWVAVTVGSDHTLGLKSDGTLWAWGDNAYGQLGDGTTDNKSSPIQTSVVLNGWLTITTGDFYTIGLKSDGTLWGWGRNDNGQLGDSTTVNKSIPVQIGANYNWVAIVAGGSFSLGLKSNGTLWAWGYNNYGQLGDGTTVQKSSPVQVGVDSNWITIMAGLGHALGLKSDGTLWAWGYNTSGQLGDGTTLNKSVPVQIGVDNNWVGITAGSEHTLGLKSNGTLWVWGRNAYGQLGDGTTVDKSSPVQIGTDNNWVGITAGDSHNHGLKSDATFWAWGYNAFGQLGDGTTVDKSSPIKIGTDNNWVSITEGWFHTHALKSDGTLWSWGFNYYGQLGDNSTVNQSSPVQVGTDNNWVVTTAGYGHTLALKSDREQFCATGYNFNGQLGKGDTTNSNVFVCSTNQPPCSTTLITSQINVSCFGGSNGSAGVSASGGTSPYSYKWNNGSSSQNVTALTAGSYYITVTDANNCQVDSVIVITEPDELAISFSQISASCFGEANGSASITTTGGTIPYSYKWSNGNTSQNVTALTAGSYYITVTDANNCQVDTVIIITEPDELTISLSQINVSCFGENNGSAVVSVTGDINPYSYKWSNGATSQNVTALTAGAYYITVTDANSCQADSVIVITEPVAALSISSSQINVSCYGGSNGSASISAIGGTSPYSYKWSNGNTSQNVTSLFAGTYYITVIDANNCKANSVIVITQPNPIGIILSKTESACIGVNSGTASVSAYGGVPGYSYLWSNGATSKSISGLNVGNYNVQVTDSLKCKSSKFFYIYCDLVWPGDINGDMRANHYDLLSLGMIYGLTGPVRDSVDIKFEGKESLDWSKFFKSGRNQKHGDCNGDGVVNKMDAYAIKKNFGKSYGKSSSVNKKYNSSNPDLYFQVESDDIAPGTSVEVSIMVGRDTVALYGIGFEIKVDVNLIDPSTMQLTWTNSWLGTEDVDMLTFDTVDVSSGDIFVACVRTDFNSNTSYGEIARMKFNIRSDTTFTDTTKLNMVITSEEGGVSTTDGDSVVFNDAKDTLLINPTSIRENTLLQSSFKIYPNPTDGTIQLIFGSKVNIETITVYNELGQAVYEENKKNCYKNNLETQCIVSLPDIENGIYSIRVKTSGSTYQNRFTYLKK